MINQELADKSGVPLATVNRILSGATPNPSYETATVYQGYFACLFSGSGRQLPRTHGRHATLHVCTLLAQF